MAQFIGYLRGCRGEASRLGSESSGLRTTAASWEGRVVVYLTSTPNGDRFEVMLDSWQGSNTQRKMLAMGLFRDFQEKPK